MLLSDHVANDAGFLDAGQSHVEALELHAEPLVVDPEQMQDGGVQIANVGIER